MLANAAAHYTLHTHCKDARLRTLAHRHHGCDIDFWYRYHGSKNQAKCNWHKNKLGDLVMSLLRCAVCIHINRQTIQIALQIKQQ